MSVDDQLRDLQKRVEALEEEVFPGPPTDPSGQREIPSEVEDELRRLRTKLAELAERQENTDRRLNRAVRVVAELQRLLQAVKDAGLRAVRRWAQQIQARTFDD